MFPRCRVRRPCARAFTLIELLMTVAVLAAALVLPVAWRSLPAEGPARSARLMPPYSGPPLGEGESLLAYTDRGRPVPLVYYPHRPAPAPELAAAEERWLHATGLAAVLVRTAPPTGAYVCHDWVFTGGRYELVGCPVEAILQDNAYHEVAAPRAGDLAV